MAAVLSAAGGCKSPNLTPSAMADNLSRDSPQRSASMKIDNWLAISPRLRDVICTIQGGYFGNR